jgi:pyridoxal phosphate enzyme (YggS family)
MIAKQLNTIKQSLPAHVTLVAVSKTKPNADVMEAYETGQRIFGENKVQEMCDKHDALPKDIEWHFIGHLQRNKVKYMAEFVSLIHGVDSFKLLQEINKQAKKVGRTIPVLLQFHIAQEATKFGLDLNEAKEFLSSEDFKQLNNISIIGVMGMATFTDNTEQITQEFASLKSIFTALKTSYFTSNQSFEHISMGMSGDYELAIKQGSTMVRIGSTIFGSRN